MKFGNGYPSMGEDPNGEYIRYIDFKQFEYGNGLTEKQKLTPPPPPPITNDTVLIKEGESPKKSPIPICIDCKHQTYKSKPGANGQPINCGTALCTRRRYFSPVYGECVETTRCYEERESFFGCGKKGRYFEPKTDQSSII